MAAVKIYVSAMCPFCWRAKSLLQAKGAEVEEIDVTFSPSKKRQMVEMAGGETSVPQIWIGDTHVGGSDELCALEANGKLDALLAT